MADSIYTKECHEITCRAIARDLYFYVQGYKTAFNTVSTNQATEKAIAEKFYQEFKIAEDLYNFDTVLRAYRGIKKKVLTKNTIT